MITGANIATDGLVLNLDAGNVKSYPGTGNSWIDLTGNNNATLYNTPTFSSTNLGGFYFDGVNEYVSLGNNKYQYQDNFTVEGFVRYDTLPTNTGQECGARHPIICNNAWGYNAWVNNTGFFTINIYDSSSTSKAFNSNNNVIGNFLHFVFYKQGINCYMFINGTLNNSTQLNSTNIYYQPSFPQFNIGGNYSCGSNIFYGKGYIYNIKIYNKVLTNTEIQQNYQAIKSRYFI